MDGVRVRLLDAAGNIVPLGVPGELCIGGGGVARGYLGRPALTAERFRPDSSDESPGARLYHTGDRARVGRDGLIEYLGRIDQQVKLRGFRIEPAEIATVLEEHPEVSQALVTVVAHDEDPRLVAYVTAVGAVLPAAAELRRHAATRVPEFMVPAFFVSLRAFPTTPSGKIDRSRLPRPEWAAATGPSSGRDAIERDVADVWGQLLWSRAGAPTPSS